MNHHAVGSRGVPFPLAIERGKVIEFARALRSSDPAFLSEPDPVIPPTFLTTILFWQELVPGANPWAELEMDQQRGMHAEQEYIFFGPPPRAGTQLTCTSRIESLYEKEGRRGGSLTFAVMVTDFTEESGRLVAQARMTGVETSKPPEDQK